MGILPKPNSERKKGGEKYLKQILTDSLRVCVFSCGGGLHAARTQAAYRRPAVQQQGGGTLHEGGEELRARRGALPQGPGAGAAHRKQVRCF